MILKFLLISIFLIIKLQSSSAQNNLPGCPDENLQWLPHLKNCQHYFVCRQGQLFERSCAPGLLFNNPTGQCMFPNFVNCQLPCPQNDDPNLLIFMPKYDDCSRFYICDAGRAVLRSCADGLMYDIENEWCDLPQNVDCGIRGNGTLPVETTQKPGDSAPNPTIRTTTTTSSPTTINVDRFDCPVERGPFYFHHTVHCHKYFRCYNGISFLRECEHGLFFDYYTKTCTDNAVCYYPGIDDTTVSP